MEGGKMLIGSWLFWVFYCLVVREEKDEDAVM